MRPVALRPPVSGNYITFDIVITTADRSTPRVSFAVFLSANRPGQDPGDAENCQEVYFNDPQAPRGVYRCTAIISGPGAWEFTGTVNEPGTQALITTVGYTGEFPDAVKLRCEACGAEYIVQGSAFEVFLLQSHVVVSNCWLLLAGVLAFLAVPRMRRMLSASALHALEIRLGFLTSALWASFLLSLGTGLYLLGTQTTYQAPFSANRFSVDAWQNVTALPYGQAYFTALYAKILLFLVMAAATVVLLAAAGREAVRAEDAPALERDHRDEPWAAPAGTDLDGVVAVSEAPVAGGTGTVRSRPVDGELGGAALWASVVVLAFGAGGIGLCVTVLKYCHELVEAAVAASILSGR